MTYTGFGYGFDEIAEEFNEREVVGEYLNLPLTETLWAIITMGGNESVPRDDDGDLLNLVEVCEGGLIVSGSRNFSSHKDYVYTYRIPVDADLMVMMIPFLLKLSREAGIQEAEGKMVMKFFTIFDLGLSTDPYS